MLRTLSIIIGFIAVAGLLLAFIIGPGKKAASEPSDEVANMSSREIPSIDANRPAVTETAAFALG